MTKVKFKSVAPFTLLLLVASAALFIKPILLPMRVTEEEEIGLDATQHDEKYLQGTLLL